ncbi:hypothetical protein HPB48_019437 [Haemaphysalis longicornis]|uniref:Uncharacterized protein n=1 Tax=Haemaphysalis longicornis TaxID=44386 RepID=A0A9J6FNK6_HAELO|nr:hypothetical protein HPB48_019437 [Haemaphysalis longicornis]
MLITTSAFNIKLSAQLQLNASLTLQKMLESIRQVESIRWQQVELHPNKVTVHRVLLASQQVKSSSSPKAECTVNPGHAHVQLTTFQNSVACAGKIDTQCHVARRNHRCQTQSTVHIREASTGDHGRKSQASRTKEVSFSLPGTRNGRRHLSRWCCTWTRQELKVQLFPSREEVLCNEHHCPHQATVAELKRKLDLQQKKIRKLEQQLESVLGDSMDGGFLKDLIFSVIEKCEDAGCLVDAVISDMGPSNKALWKRWGISAK